LNQNESKEILLKYKTVAVVGLSRDPEKYSHIVSSYLKSHGFRIIPVNPFADEVLGEKSYKSLLDIPIEIQKIIEIIDIFRPPNEVAKIVEQAIRLKAAYGKPKVIWMQLGIINKQAANVARKVGLIVVI
jgi:predicted CoA-binding protein